MLSSVVQYTMPWHFGMRIQSSVNLEFEEFSLIFQRNEKLKHFYTVDYTFMLFVYGYVEETISENWVSEIIENCASLLKANFYESF